LSHNNYFIGIKGMAGREKYGGYANTAYDPCYHLECDTVDNVSQESLIIMARAAANALEILAATDLSTLE
jgi:hypothetical protein